MKMKDNIAEAINAIDDFMDREFGDGTMADYSDYDRVCILYTEVDNDTPAQWYVDLHRCILVLELRGKPAYAYGYPSYDSLARHLDCIGEGELVNLAEDLYCEWEEE